MLITCSLQLILLLVFLKALEVEKQESRLFRFLNGLDEIYSCHKSKLLLMDSLPSIGMACSVIQQEKSQGETLKMSNLHSHDMAVLYSKSGNAVMIWL